MKRLAHLCLPLLTGLACTRERPEAIAEPPVMSAPAPAPAELSRFSVPIEYDFSAVLALVDKAVPRTFGSMDSVRQMGDDGRRHYAFAATRGPFTAKAIGNQLHLTSQVEYSARGFYKPPLAPTISAGCGKGDDKPRMIIELQTPIRLSKNWHLVSHAAITRVEPASTEQRDHCDVSILHKDVTPQVVEAARAGITSQLTKIDARVAAVDLTPRVAEWWKLLSAPIRLADGLWLTLAPEQLRMGTVRGASKTLIVPVTLDARPSIVTGTSAPMREVPLPPLARDTAGVNGFHVVLDGLIDYGTAARELTSALSEKTIEEGGHKVAVRSVNVAPLAAGQLAVLVTFQGDAKGVLRLVGTPRIDHAHDVATVPDLDVDIKSSNAILNTYAWLKSDHIRKLLRERARISTGPALIRGRELLHEGLNRKLGDAVTLRGTVDSLSARSLIVTRDGLAVRAEAYGHAGMTVRQR